MQSKFVFNDVELMVDFSDAETVEKYENAMHELSKKGNKSFQRVSQAIRYECEAINTVFDAVFGEGTAEKLFKGKLNRDASYQAVHLLIEHMNKSKVLSDTHIRELVSKYQRNKSL